MYKQKLIALTLVFAAPVIACDGSVEPVLTAENQEALSFDFCPNASADYIRYIGPSYDTPPNSLPLQIESGSGGYYYDTADACNRFIVEARIGDLGNYDHLVMSGSAHDLPSSNNLNPTKPNNSIDCNQFVVYETFYHKKGSGNWSTLATRRQEGSWSSGTCNMILTAGTSDEFQAVPTSGSGWDYYRVAVSTKLRSSGQEVKVNLSGGFDPPQ